MTTFTIAGSYHEFFAFLSKKNYPRDTQEYTFISDPMRLKGMYDVAILCVGNYRRSPVLSYPYLTHEQTVRHIRLVDIEGNEVRS